MLDKKPIDYYLSLTNGGEFEVDLSKDEAAVILKAHDWGVSELDANETAILDRAISSIKESIV